MSVSRVSVSGHQREVIVTQSQLNFSGKDALITSGLGFICYNLAWRFVELGTRVTLVDSLIPEYGSHLSGRWTSTAVFGLYWAGS